MQYILLMTQQTRRTVLEAGVAGIAIGTGGVGSTGGVSDGSDADDEDADNAESDGARARVVHLSPDAPTVDVYIDGTRQFEAITPYSAESEYLPVKTGTHTVAITPTGEGRDGAILTSKVTVDDPVDCTLALIGEGCAESDRPVQLSVLIDDNSPTPSGRGRVRLFHAIPDAPRSLSTPAGRRLSVGWRSVRTSTSLYPVDAPRSLSREPVTTSGSPRSRSTRPQGPPTMRFS